MRKIIFIILIILLLIGAGLTIANGFELGNFQIWGIRAISAQNENIDKRSQELSDLVSITYPGSLAELDTSSKTLSSTKEEYEDKAILVSNSKYYMQTEKYEIEFLWTKLGNYAKDNNVQIKIDVVNSATSGLYDLNFTIAGEYLKVADFIYDVENDSKLGFKIEDFHMSANGDGVQGSFACKEISINIESVDNNAGSSGEKGNTDNTANSSKDGNTTNTTEQSNNNTTNTTEQSNNSTTNTTTQSNNTTNNTTAQENTQTGTNESQENTSTTGV